MLPDVCELFELDELRRLTADESEGGSDMGYDLTFAGMAGRRGGGDLSTTRRGQEGEVVLDAIHRLQATQARDLAVRWNCKAGKCGSCSAEINGRPRLLCMTRLSTSPPQRPITVTPMRTFPVIRDLVTDVSFNYRKATRGAVRSCRRRRGAGRVPDAASGRRALAGVPQVHRMFPVPEHLSRDPRPRGEQGELLRAAFPHAHRRAGHAPAGRATTVAQRAAQDEHGLGMCNITKCCTEVCPEHIKITDNAIIPMKERVVDLRFDPLIRLFRRNQKLGQRSTGGWVPARRDIRRSAGPRCRRRSRAATPSDPFAEHWVARRQADAVFGVPRAPIGTRDVHLGAVRCGDLVTAESEIRFAPAQCGLPATRGQRFEAGPGGIHPQVMGDQIEHRDIEAGVPARTRRALRQTRCFLDSDDDLAAPNDPVDGRRSATRRTSWGDRVEGAAGHWYRMITERGGDPVDGTPQHPQRCDRED